MSAESLFPQCPHGHGELRWVEDTWYCPLCGDEWADLPPDPIFYEPDDHSRASDPATSHKGARDVVPRAGSQMYKLLAVYVSVLPGGLMSEEAALMAGLTHTGYWKRCSDLLKLGYLEPTGEEREAVSGSLRAVHRATKKAEGLVSA